jgi:primary-amine oxidase
MDRFYGIGASSIRMIPGYDCPYHAVFDGNYSTTTQQAYTQDSAVCLFETDIGTPITRHNNPVWAQATKGSQLVVRMVATVGNYDYLWDYGFFVDGTITVDAHASGYIQGNYFRPDDEGQWGPRVAETLAGTLHTHVMNFKADFDLIDENNTFVKTDIIVENITQPWFTELGTFEMMRYNISDVESEDDGLINLAPNGQTMFAVVNKDRLNEWGVPRGYRILPGLSNVVLASQNSPFFLKNAQFAKQPIAVSRQHDNEPSSTATLNQNVPQAPLTEFYRFFDGESLVQEDLVTWVNLGMHHYTRAEDIPNTLMSEAHSSIMFAPQNWGNTELTKDLSNAVMMYAEGPENEIVIDTNGVEPPASLPLGPEDSLVGVFSVEG